MQVLKFQIYDAVSELYISGISKFWRILLCTYFFLYTESVNVDIAYNAEIICSYFICQQYVVFSKYKGQKANFKLENQFK